MGGVGSGGGGGVGSVGGGGVGSGGDGGVPTGNPGGVPTGNRGGVTTGGGGGVETGNGGGIVNGGGGGVSSGGFAMSPVIPDPAMRRTDLEALHPILRESVLQLLQSFQSEGLPFRLYEGFRSPQRQAWLYQQGQSSGSMITESDAWASYHQYGLAVDFVLWLNGTWSWNTLGINAGRWQRLYDLGERVGLEHRTVEVPHLQVSGLNLADLQAGKFPSDGDDSWRDSLEASVISWSGTPPAPPFTSSRPPIVRSK